MTRESFVSIAWRLVPYWMNQVCSCRQAARVRAAPLPGPWHLWHLCAQPAVCCAPRHGPSVPSLPACPRNHREPSCCPLPSRRLQWEQQWGAECSSMLFELPHFALELLVVLPCVQVGPPPAAHASTTVQCAPVLARCVRCCSALARRALDAASAVSGHWNGCSSGPPGHWSLLQWPCNVPTRACRYCAAGCGSWRSRTYASPCRRRQRTVRRLQRSGLAGRGAPSQPPPRLGQSSAGREVPLALTLMLTPMREQAPTRPSAGCRT